MFKMLAEEGMARRGVLNVTHGRVDTPAFMAVATKGAVKHISTDELKEMGAQAIISNAFLLSLRPGLETIELHGGLNKFMAWEGASFTDCGGFQVLSLEKEYHLNTSNNGISFRSPFDGTKHLLTPEKCMEIQNALDSDVAMALDHMPLYGCTKEEALESMKHTHAWMDSCKRLHKNDKQLLFGIAQGSFYPDLRKKSIEFIDSLGFDGIAYGGLAIGEPKEEMFEMIRLSSENCSREKIHYAMGVGSPADLVKCIALGVDIFDSVFPTRNARHGSLFTWNGAINIDNAKYKDDHSPIDEECKCFVCKKHTRSYLRHLITLQEPLGLRLASFHNLYFMQDLMKRCRMALENGEFGEFKQQFLENYKNGACKNGACKNGACKNGACKNGAK